MRTLDPSDLLNKLLGQFSAHLGSPHLQITRANSNPTFKTEQLKGLINSSWLWSSKCIKDLGILSHSLLFSSAIPRSGTCSFVYLKHQTHELCALALSLRLSSSALVFSTDALSCFVTTINLLSFWQASCDKSASIQNKTELLRWKRREKNVLQKVQPTWYRIGDNFSEWLILVNDCVIFTVPTEMFASYRALSHDKLCVSQASTLRRELHTLAGCSQQRVFVVLWIESGTVTAGIITTVVCTIQMCL